MNTFRTYTSGLTPGAVVILGLWKEDEVDLNSKLLLHIINPPMRMRKGLHYFITTNWNILKHQSFSCYYLCRWD